MIGEFACKLSDKAMNYDVFVNDCFTCTVRDVADEAAAVEQVKAAMGFQHFSDMAETYTVTAQPAWDPNGLLPPPPSAGAR